MQNHPLDSPKAAALQRHVEELEETVGGLSSRALNDQHAGSIGIALQGTMVSGLMPFGPAFDKLEVGDEIEVVDGAEVTASTVVSAISGEVQSTVHIRVRRKRNGDRVTMHLVRTCSARLLTAHSLAVNLHNVLVLCSGLWKDPAQTDVHGFSSQGAELEEACEVLKECAKMLVELQQHVSRSEAHERHRLARIQTRMVLQVKELQEHFRHFLSPAVRGKHTVDDPRYMQHQTDLDRESLVCALKDSEAMLAQLEAQLKSAMDALEETELKFSVSLQENRVLLDEVQRLGDKQRLSSNIGSNIKSGRNVRDEITEIELMRETVKRQDGCLEQLRGEINTHIQENKKLHEELKQLRQSSRGVDDGKQNEKMAALEAEFSLLKEINSSHHERLKHSEQQLLKAQEGEQEVRVKLLQSRDDLAHLMRIVEDKDATLSQAEAEKERICKEHDQACAFADSVQAEIKRLEGLLDELRKRQTMTSVMTECLTNERDELRQEITAAEKCQMHLEMEVTGFKQLCSVQKQVLKKSSDELEMLRKRLLQAETELKHKEENAEGEVHQSVQTVFRTKQSQPTMCSGPTGQSMHTTDDNDSNTSCRVPGPVFPQASQIAQMNEVAAQRIGSVWAQASKGHVFHLDQDVAQKNQTEDCKPRVHIAEHARTFGSSASRLPSYSSGGVYSAPKKILSASMPTSRSTSPNSQAQNRSGTPTNLATGSNGRTGSASSSSYHTAQQMSPRYVQGIPPAGISSVVYAFSPANKVHGGVSPRGLAVPAHRTALVSAKNKTAAWLQCMSAGNGMSRTGGFTVAQSQGSQT